MTPSYRIESLILDFDGTLVDSSPGILSSFTRTLTAHGIPPVVALDRTLIGPPLAATLARITGLTTAEALAPIIDSFKADYDATGYIDTVPYPGVAEALQQLNALGLRLFIATNKRIGPTRKILTHLGWAQHFAAVYALDAMQPRLPDKTAMTGEILRREAIEPTRTAFVGDSLEDARAAWDNGIAFYAATWGYGGLAETGPHANWVRLTSIADLLDRVQR